MPDDDVEGKDEGKVDESPPPPEPKAPVEAKTDETPEPSPPAPAPEKEKDWKERRIDQLTAKLREEQAKNRTATETAPKRPGVIEITEEELAQRVNQSAAAQAITAKFNADCNAVAAKGREAFPDFDSRVKDLGRLVTPGDSDSINAYNSFLSAAIETGEAPKILHALGGNLDEAARILAMSPIKMTVELTKMALREGKDVSGAPKPITPVSGRTASHASIDPDDRDRADHLSTAEWMKRREAQVKARRTG